MATMSQAIKEAFGESGGALSREAIKRSVESRYPGQRLESSPKLVSPPGMVETPRLQAKRRAW